MVVAADPGPYWCFRSLARRRGYRTHVPGGRDGGPPADRGPRPADPRSGPVAPWMDV